ncbi:hypothetical protein KIPE111705_23160 [Kibdelosporangium persicum]|uniref:Diacylglycerol O-acyltransferase n=1 Tax=Kibdelosporangium persicum TaxID=2698649 RepID=A0ABX2FHU4_9PSEU|nr:hypothetical protein [Kibdelosporangium persicum]NRN70971.1 hypothetical protein [Kibdelosporangium persicum]
MTTERLAGPIENVLIASHVAFAGGTQSVVGGELDRPVPVPAVLTGLREVCRLQPMLRARLAGATPEWRFVFDRSFDDVEVTVHDRAGRTIEELLATENDRYLDITTGPVWRALVLTEESEVVAVVATFAHAIVDGMSVLAFMRQLADGINGRTATRQPLPVRPPMEDMVPDHSAAGGGVEMSQPAGAWAFDEAAEPGRRRTVILVDYLDADDLTAVRALCRAAQVKMDAFFVAVVQQALATTIPDALLLPALCAFDVRGALEPPVSAEEIGVYMKDFPVFDPAWVSRELTLWERAASVSAQLSKRRAEGLSALTHYPVAQLCAEIQLAAEYPSTSFWHSFSVSNMGRQPGAAPQDGARFSSVHLNSTDRIGNVGIQVVVHEVDGALCLALSYADPLVPARRISAVREEILRILRSEAHNRATQAVATKGTV